MRLHNPLLALKKHKLGWYTLLGGCMQQQLRCCTHSGWLTVLQLLIQSSVFGLCTCLRVFFV